MMTLMKICTGILLASASAWTPSVTLVRRRTSMRVALGAAPELERREALGALLAGAAWLGTAPAPAAAVADASKVGVVRRAPIDHVSTPSTPSLTVLRRAGRIKKTSSRRQEQRADPRSPGVARLRHLFEDGHTNKHTRTHTHTHPPTLYLLQHTRKHMYTHRRQAFRKHEYQTLFQLPWFFFPPTLHSFYNFWRGCLHHERE